MFANLCSNVTLNDVWRACSMPTRGPQRPSKTENRLAVTATATFIQKWPCRGDYSHFSTPNAPKTNPELLMSNSGFKMALVDERICSPSLPQQHFFRKRLAVRTMNEYASRPCHSNIFPENVLPCGLQPLFEHERRYHLYNVNVALYTLVMIVAATAPRAGEGPRTSSESSSARSQRAAPGAKSGADGLELTVLERLCHLKFGASLCTGEPLVEVSVQVRQQRWAALVGHRLPAGTPARANSRAEHR